ncbi:unnamed protein product [Ilex paraguariensis]|uniref:Bifunctional inhibitor/plant lipid transfer protein/seed storage helical domain-containing protein n=1 Tax=Ilex paraguariensis TaxID=185542 RepID=A0ABC8TRY2_9AQUA
MAATNHFGTIFIISLLFFVVFSDACDVCQPKPTPPPLVPPLPPLAPAPAGPFCPKDTLKLGVCLDLLGLVNIVVGTPPSSECCALLEGLADLEVAACLCTVIQANVLGINLDVPVALSVLVSACGKTIPPGFVCE